MAGTGVDRIGYDLFSDGGRTIKWGDSGALGATVTGTGTGANQSLTLYGRSLAGPLPVPGAYSDTVIAAVSF